MENLRVGLGLGLKGSERNVVPGETKYDPGTCLTWQNDGDRVSESKD